MDPRTIYVKTAKGIGEIKNKTNHLPGKVRRLLILVDGRSSAAEIAGKISNLSEAKRREAFEKLLEEGFIRESGVASDGPEELEDDPMLTATAVERILADGEVDEEADVDDRESGAEAEARAAADVAAKKAREDEERRRWEVADRARVEAEERVRAQRELERQEAEERERKAAEEKARWEAEQRSKLEAQMKAEAEVAERREAENRAREDAARQPAPKAAPQASPQERERLEAEEKKRLRNEQVQKAEEERQRVVAELLGKAKADQDNKARSEAEAKRRAVADAEAKKRAALKADKESKTRQKIVDRAARRPLPKFVLPAIGGGVLLLVFAAAGVLTLIPFSADKPAIEKLIGDRIGEKVTVGSLHVGVLPLPHVNLSDVSIGDAGDIKIDTVTVPWDMFGGDNAKKAYKQVELDTVSIKQSALARLSGWTAIKDANATLSIENLALRNIRLTLNNVTLDPFGGQITLGRDGSLLKANFYQADLDRFKADIVAQDGTLVVSFSAKKWRAPLAEPLVLAELRFKGVARPGAFDATNIEAGIADGSVKGSGHLEWGEHWKLTSNLEIAGMDLENITPRFTQEITLTGRLDTKLAIATQGSSMATLFSAPRIEGDFSLANGSLGNVDMMAAIVKKPNYESVHGGFTVFKKFSGNVLYADQRFQFRQLSLGNGSLSASGNIDVAPDNTIGGKVSLELGTEGNSTKDTIGFSGTLKDPQMHATK
jgi:hypothetical protein